MVPHSLSIAWDSEYRSGLKPISPMPRGHRLMLPLLALLLTLSAAAGSEAGFAAAQIEHAEHKLEHESRGHDPARRAHRVADATHGLIKSGREPLSIELNPLQGLASATSQSLTEDAERSLSSEDLLLPVAMHTDSTSGHLGTSERHIHELTESRRLQSTAEKPAETSGLFSMEFTGLQKLAGSAAETAQLSNAKSRRLQISQDGHAKEAGELADGQSVGLLQRYDELSEVMDLVADESVLEQSQVRYQRRERTSVSWGRAVRF